MANIPKTSTNYAQFPVCSLFVLGLIWFVPKALGIVLADGIWHTTVSQAGALAYHGLMLGLLVCH